MTRKAAEQTDLVVAGQAPTGLDLIAPEDLLTPRIILFQPISEGEGRVGEYTNSVTGECFPRREFQLVSFTPGRAMWVKDDDEPVCRSFDACVPVDRIEDPPSVECTTCEMAAGKPSKCQKVYNFAALDTTTGMPCLLRFQKTSSYAGRKICTFQWMNKIPIYQVRLVLSAEKASGSGKRNYYKQIVSELKVVDDPAAVKAAQELA